MNELHQRNFGCWTRLRLVGACLEDRSGRFRGSAHKENRNVQSRLASVVIRKKGDVAGSFANPVEASCIVRASVSSVKTYLLLKVIASTCDEPVVREASSL
jgi:hypothetical protein